MKQGKRATQRSLTLHGCIIKQLMLSATLLCFSKSQPLSLLSSSPLSPPPAIKGTTNLTLPFEGHRRPVSSIQESPQRIFRPRVTL
ncbi:hypothetical protein E2C01_019624 [Portunus trituberculatus]|uniref:Uncharacterized protein n=1 Tax=Portunus trituberculatus TaxID=210409 RepID=A0A5B7E0Y9_PORTR|nr:hypothetical protein [Portunus trituberculatus]